MKVIIGWIVFIIGLVGGLYIGGWVMFIHPITEACQHFDAGTLTATIVGTTILKCVFSCLVASIIIYVSVLISIAIFKK